MVCNTCNGKLLPRTLQIKCGTCGMHYHGNCVNLQQSDIDALNAANQQFKCDYCLQKGEKNASEPTLSDIFKEIRVMRMEQKSIGESIDACHKDLKSLREEFETQAKLINDCTTKIELLERTNITLERENMNLKERLNNIEQYIGYPNLTSDTKEPHDSLRQDMKLSPNSRLPRDEDSSIIGESDEDKVDAIQRSDHDTESELEVSDQEALSDDLTEAPLSNFYIGKDKVTKWKKTRPNR
ncbi:hypothetical protein RN001_010090 [Aquatica leii]|uniref:Zinc finger PHD-type domain-containing protein n=1 Tax=Aquatica leii TaxID=1421715 RepID=A0AAN7P5Y7_9COLE|nr:hypothetical protein RN001_010090 [Aquatica leii]